MAIQNGVLSFRGKLGELVGYALPNAVVAGSMGARVYKATIANPKTEGQALQRLKMTAAVSFYRQLTPILNNAWQGQKYGTKSRQYFMKLAMTQSEGIPFVDKGDKKFYPGLYLVSQGSLPTQSVTAISGALATTSINVGVLDLSGASWGEVSQAIVNNTFGVQDGDKITFIGVGQKNGEFAPMYSYVIVNTTSSTTVADVVSSSKMKMQADASGNLLLGFEQLDTEVAAAVIVSRYPTTNGGSWLRSTARLFCTSSYLAEYMGTTRYGEAVASYMASAGSLSSDWYLNRGLTGYGTDGSWNGSDSNLQIISWGNIAGAGSYQNESGNMTTPQASTQPSFVVMSDGTGRGIKTRHGFIGAYQDETIIDISGSDGQGYLTTAANLAQLQADVRGSYPSDFANIVFSGWLTISDNTLANVPKISVTPRP